MLFNAHTHQCQQQPDIISIYNYNIAEKKNCELSYFSAGIHPWHADSIDLHSSLEFLKKLNENIRFLAIGECGIDKAYGPPIEMQLLVFEKQATLANDLQKPVIIHAVRSYNEIINVHSSINPIKPWIVHGYRKNLQQAEQLISKGFILSIGKHLLVQQSLMEIVEKTDLDYILLESDEEDTVIIRSLYEKVAQLKNTTVAMVEKIIHCNFEKVFSISLG